MSDLRARISKIVSGALGRDIADANESTDLRELGADDLALVEIAMGLETEFGIEINDDECEGFASIASILAFIIRVTGAAHVG